MPKFVFQGRDSAGELVTGELDAVSPENVAAMLAARNIIAVKINAGKMKKKWRLSALQSDIVIAGWNDKVSTTELIMFCRQMYTITKSGMPLTKGLRGISATVTHSFFSTAINDVANRLEAGSTLAQSMRHHTRVFDDLFVSMISVGEASGSLDQVFNQLGFYLERDEETRKRVKQATRYPTFVGVAIIAAVVAVNIWVIPAFAGMFKKFNAELPIMTKILIGTSDFFTQYGTYLGGIVMLAVGAWLYFVRTPKGSMFWGRSKLRLPIMGQLIEYASMARYARSVSLMLKTGVPVNKALALCAAAIDNVFIAKKINDIQAGVERGESMLKTHIQAKLFTPLVIQMIAVGEESGQIEALLMDVAEFYEREVDYGLKTLTDRIEPILILTMAVLVGILAVGVFLPMWSLYEIR